MSIELAKRLLQIEHEKGGRLGEDGQLYYRVPESVFSMARNAVQSDQPDDCNEAFNQWNKSTDNSLIRHIPKAAWQAAWNSRPKRESGSQAIAMLRSMIDGGEECRGRDSEISDVIRILEHGK